MRRGEIVIQLNQLYNEDCILTMKRMPDNLLDLVVTSPPYDGLRKYNGYVFDFEATANELYRVMKKGGVVVWIVGDETRDGSETLTSFEQAIYFKKLGFKVETMIYEKSGFAHPSSARRYHQVHEYMFVLSKDAAPKTFNPIKDRPNVYRGHHSGETNPRSEFGMRYNIWRVPNGGGNTWDMPPEFKHPAPTPFFLVRDHVNSWSNKGDIVYDPFGGTGTVAAYAFASGRYWITSEISEEYCNMIRRRFGKIKPLNLAQRKEA